MDKQLDTGFKKARRITRHYAKTFFLASLLLPKDKRLASYAVYAFCRISDESVDGISDVSKETQILSLRENLDGVYASAKPNDCILAAFRYTVNKYNIPKEYFINLLDGMQMDIDKSRYADFTELYAYCYNVAGVIGLIMLKILDPGNESARDSALRLGVAMQLTNILRDVKEDFLRGRIYIPLSQFKEFGVTEKDILNESKNENIKKMIAFEVARARGYYAESSKGINLILKRRIRLVVLAMKEMYSAILNKIESNDYDVFSSRAVVGGFAKLRIILKVIIKTKDTK